MNENNGVTNSFKPCPFCNSNEITPWTGTISGIKEVAIRCKDCGAIGPQFFSENKEALSLATTLWNNRPRDNNKE